MATGPGFGPDTNPQGRLAALREADSLADLVPITGAPSEHAAYLAAKREWYRLRERQFDDDPHVEGVPGTCVAVDGTDYWIHGITHANTGAEGEYLREHVADYLDRGATVYCEQGVRRMYFDSLPAVCSMDDYRWAMEQCRALDAESHVDDLESNFEGITEDLDTLTSEFQEAVFSLIHGNGNGGRYSRRVRRTLGDVASDFLTSHEDLATGDDFESFQRTRRAATDPDHLVDLQRYYEKRFLPQPVEREWLRRHDPELELVTHARNARMADYAVYHNGSAREVHLVVGAAHQPGVRYYLQAHRDGERSLEGFEPIP